MNRCSAGGDFEHVAAFQNQRDAVEDVVGRVN